MPTAVIGKNNLYYEVEGKGEPLVLIAGYGCDLGFWETIRRPLSHHFQLVMFDNRGMGRSENSKETFTAYDMAQDTVDLIDVLGIKRPHILGHSLGSAVAQIIAHDHPDKVNKIIIAQSFIKLAPAASSALSAFLNLYRNGVSMYAASKTTLPWLFSDAWLGNSELCEFFLKIQSENPYIPQIEGLTKQSEALLGFDSTSWFSKITKKPLILAGSEDRLCPLKDAEKLAAGIPGAKFHIFQKVGHMAPLENPKEFCEVVFLELLS